MRTIPAPMVAAIEAGDFTGDTKAVARAVIYDDPYLGIYPVPDFSVDRMGKRVNQVFSSLPFRQVEVHGKELPNIRSITTNRAVDGNIASATITLYNTRPLPPGVPPDTAGSFDQLGYYTYNRGRTSYSQSTWGHDPNEWRDVLVPDSMIITYQGYGECDYDLLPEDDGAVLQSGVWLVDDVTYTADGLITLECRDAARLLSDQHSFPPVVPRELYPQKWAPYQAIPQPDAPQQNHSGWVKGTFHDSSTTPYYYHYTGGVVFGHHPLDAFDNNWESYWLSVGNQDPNGRYADGIRGAKEWIETKVPAGMKLSGARISAKGGPYTVFVSVFQNGAWRGSRKISYTPPNNTGIDNGSGIPFEAEGRVERDGTYGIIFAQPLEGVTKVRFTFTDLKDFGVGAPFRYRVGVRSFEITGATTTYVPVPDKLVGNFGDYSEIVKTLLAWGGFYWPQDGKMYLTDTNTDVYSFATADPWLMPESEDRRLDRLLQEVKEGRTFDSIRYEVDAIKWGNSTTHELPLPTPPATDAAYWPEPIGTATDAAARAHIAEIFTNRNVPIERGPGGRIWGDIEMSGRGAKVDLGVEIWDKKPLLDGITYIKDILGFVFFVDEHGAAQWRSPNTFRKGNWLSDASGLSLTRTADYISIDDEDAILGLRAVLSSRSIKDHVFVANVNGKVGAVSAGRVPQSVGFRRVGGYTDQNFTEDEDGRKDCQIMADMITLRQLWTYRQNSLRIPADPRIQVDDQVEITERTTGEAYFHYVKAISTQWDLESGKWTMDLTTQWLGSDPTGEWAFTTTGLAPETVEYLTALGQV